MVKKGLFVIGLVAIGATSCIEHEVIPPPEPEVELECSFEGNIGSAFIEYTKNVNGYSCTPGLAKQTQSGLTDAQYLFAMTSQEQIQYVQIGIGSLSWNDPTGTERPALSLFNGFFTAPANMSPDYSNAALAGFEVQYRDENGDIWRSYETGTEPTAESGTPIPVASINVEFDPESIIQESDESGDYSKFVCYFSCPVYHIFSVPDISVVPQTNPLTMRDSAVVMNIEDAIYRGYFKR
jgi:hypothetical protein